MVEVPAERLADLERIEAAAEAWLHAWTGAQSGTSPKDTVVAFEFSKRLAAAVRSSASV